MSQRHLNARTYALPGKVAERSDLAKQLHNVISTVLLGSGYADPTARDF